MKSMSEESVSSLQRQTDGSVVHQSSYDPSSDGSLSTSILLALDEIPGFDIEAGETVVFDYIDLDALDDLFRPVDESRRTGQVTFVVDGYEVTATDDGEITIRE